MESETRTSIKTISLKLKKPFELHLRMDPIKFVIDETKAQKLQKALKADKTQFSKQFYNN